MIAWRRGRPWIRRTRINMINQWIQGFSESARSNIVPFAIFTMCATNGAYPGLAQSAQPTFQSTAEASESLFQAVQSNNGDAVAIILGGPTQLTSSRDEAQDNVERELFVRKYQ